MRALRENSASLALQGLVKVASGAGLLAVDCVQSLIAFSRSLLEIWRERFWLSYDFDGTLKLVEEIS